MLNGYIFAPFVENELKKIKMRKNLNVFAKVFAFLIVLTVFSSCAKKGVGCPNNFKVSITLPFSK